MVLAAALAVAVSIPASLAEDVFLISRASSFFFLSHMYVGQSMVHPFGPSVQQHLRTLPYQPYSVWGFYFFWKECVFPLNVTIKLQQLQVAGIALI